MDCTCNCFGVATAARVPVKRYNLLVPDVFPVVEPPFDKPLGIGIERKIKKLGEYLEKNEFRAPKVSRRLQRRLHRELGAGRYGYVKLAVEAYCHLLAQGKPEKSNLLAYELVVGTVVKRRRLLVAGPKAPLSFPEPHLGSAVGLLLSHPDPQLRKLGVDLLTRFLKCQQTSDYVPQLEAFVPLLCENAKPSVAPATAAGGAGEARAALRAACLRGLLEHLRFCARLSYVSYHLHTITFAVLECVEAAGSAAPKGSLRQELTKGVGADGSDDAALAAAAALGRGSLSAAVGASPPDVAAVLVFEELAHMTRDAAEGKKVLEFVMRFLDGRRRWLGSPVLENALAVLRAACQQEHQRYLLFSSLLHHGAAAPALAPDERAAVLALAVGEGRHLEAGLAAPALLLALRELPALLAAAGGGPEADPPPMPPQQALPQAAASPPGPVQPSSQEVELAALPRRASAAAAAQQADLQAGVLAAVGQLAAQVGDRLTLLEAVSGTLGRLRGAAPISTATLQCCVAAAQAAQPVAPTAPPGSTAPRAFPSLMLRELAGIVAGWGPQQRLLAARLLLLLLRGAADGLKEAQAAALLSAAWHAAALPDAGPAQYAALDRLVRAVLGAAPAAVLPQVLHLAAGLQAEGLGGPGGERLAQLSPAQCCAVLCVCSSALAAMAAQLGQPALQQLAAPGCEGVLQQLGVAPARGVVLGGLGGDEAGGGQQAFWQSPAAQLRFTEEEQVAAGRFLAAWRGSTSAAAQQVATAAALAAVPLFAQQGGSAAGPFKPLPQSSLMPRLMAGAFAAHDLNGGHASSGRAQRLRSVYRHVRQISLCDGESAALAALSQESAAEEDPPSSLHTGGLALPWLAGDGAAAGSGPAASAVKTADEVLAEVDAALEAAEEAMQRGGGAWPQALHSVAGGSSGSRSASLRRGLPLVANGQLLVA